MQNNVMVREYCKRVLSVKKFTDAVYLPTPFPNNFVVHAIISRHDLGEIESRKERLTIFGVEHNGRSTKITSVINDCSSVDKVSYHRLSMNQAVLRKYEKNGKIEQYIEIWGNDTHISSINVTEMKQHGMIYTDAQFSCFLWNDAGNKLLYIAERDGPEVKMLKTLKNEDSVSVYQDDWGEQLDNQRESVVCVLDIQQRSIFIIPPIDVLTVGQAIWVKEDYIVYVGWKKHPLSPGIIYCNNRRSSLYMFHIPSQTTTRISDKDECVSSPRCSPDGSTIVYLQNTAGGPHRKCSSLMKYNIKEGTNEVVVNIVEKASGDEFPGIYTYSLPQSCWSENSQFVIFSTQWRSNIVIIAVNIFTGNIKRISATSVCQGSCEALDVHNDTIIAVVSAINIQPFLVFVKFLSSPVWSFLDSRAPKGFPSISYTVQSVVPEIVCENFPFLDYEVIVSYPTETNTARPGLIIWPHGGPHSAFSTKFCHFVSAFVLLGFSVCQVNYRGSLGFGEDNLISLIGNIGVQDISDVHHAGAIVKQQLLQTLQVSEIDVFLFGGSHGGFIVSHLCARYPDYYKACICRNPVTNLISMIGGTDIPDWVWSECGLASYDDNFYGKYCPQSMWAASPLSVADKVKTPTLLLLGKHDRRVPPAQGLAYYRVLKSNNVPAKVSMFEGGHALDSALASAECLRQSANFFIEHSSGSSDSLISAN